jgi:hypothetical protein
MAGEIGKKTITVRVRDEDYEFKIPTVHDDIRVGTRVKALHRKLDPDYDGLAGGLDFNTQYNLRMCATFEILLLKSSARWPFGENPKGEVAVDTAKWLPEDAGLAGEVFGEFTDALATFRSGGNSNRHPEEPKDLASQPGS